MSHVSREGSPYWPIGVASAAAPWLNHFLAQWMTRPCATGLSFGVADALVSPCLRAHPLFAGHWLSRTLGIGGFAGILAGLARYLLS
jgi:hypothetical protein